MTDLAASEPLVNKGLATTWNSLTSLALPSTTNLLATKERGKDWLNWAVASASGTPTPVTSTPSASSVSSTISASKGTPLDRKGLCVMTMKSITKLEKYRVSTRKAWLEYVIVSQRYAIKTQILLTKLQGMQESFILILQDHLRKIVVVESSFLANQQYDIQMLFKVMEEIDVREDMRQFILKNASTPLDLYEGESEEEDEEDEDEDEDGGVESDFDRNRSDSYDGDEHDVDIVISEQGGGKPTLRAEVKKPPQGTSVGKKSNDIWGDSPWTCDIFPTLNVKLKHIKELPLPPCEETMSFSYLKSILVEKHLDELDKHSVSPSSRVQHQYLPMERVRALSRLSLVSRHIDKHNCLVGEGKAGSSLAKLEIATSTQKKKNSTPLPPQNTSSPSLSSVLDTEHPLKSSEGVESPLTLSNSGACETPVRKEKRNVPGEEEEEEEELMTYGTAEEALEKMIELQTRIRPQWAAMIEEFTEKGELNSDATSGHDHAGVSTQDSTEKPSHKTGKDEEEEGGSVSSDGSGSSHGHSNTISNTLRSENQSSEGLDQLVGAGAGAGMLNRSLKDAENQKEDNIDQAKCREIMNSFGLLDAVSVDVDDNWNGNVNQESQLPHSSLSNMSPHSVVGAVAASAHDNQHTPHPMETMPFLNTTKSDYSNNTSSDTTIVGGMTPLCLNLADPLKGSFSTPVDDFRGEGHSMSMSQFGSATPESLDFLSS